MYITTKLTITNINTIVITCIIVVDTCGKKRDLKYGVPTHPSRLIEAVAYSGTAMNKINVGAKLCSA